MGFLFQCLGGVAGGREKLREAISPLNLLLTTTASAQPQTTAITSLPDSASALSEWIFEKGLDVSHPCWHVSRGSPIKSNFLTTVTKSLYILACHISWFPGLCESKTLVVPWTSRIPSLFFWLCHRAGVGSLFPDQGANPCPCIGRKQGVLTTGQIGKSPVFFSCCHALSCISFWLESSVQLISVSDWVSHIYFAVSLTLWRPFWAFLHPAKIMLPFLVPHSSFEGDILRDRAVFFLQSSGHAIWTC